MQELQEAGKKKEVAASKAAKPQPPVKPAPAAAAPLASLKPLKPQGSMAFTLKSKGAATKMVSAKPNALEAMAVRIGKGG